MFFGDDGAAERPGTAAVRSGQRKAAPVLPGWARWSNSLFCKGNIPTASAAALARAAAAADSQACEPARCVL